MNKYLTEIAGVRILIVNTNKLSEMIIKDLQAKTYKNNIDQVKAIDLILKFNNSFSEYTPTVYSAKGTMNFNEDEFFVGYIKGIRYKVKNLFNDKTVEVAINTSKDNLKKIIKNLLTFEFNSINTHKNNTLSYSLFWYILHIILLRKGKAFIHAGVFSKNSLGTIIAGTGGCGKTSTLFNILENKEFKYIAEDFGIVDIGGNAYFNPKPVSIYASDMEFGQKILQDYYYKLNLSEKLVWNLKKSIFKLNPMIKGIPHKVMDDRVIGSAKLQNVLYFIRNNDVQISHYQVSTGELVERVLFSSMREFKVLQELLWLMRANAPSTYNIPSFSEIEEQTKNIYINTFSETQNYIVIIPHKTKPADLTNYLKLQKLI